MATNVFSGRSARLQTAATSSGTLVNFGALESFELTADRPSISVIHQDTSGWTQKLAGVANWRLTANTVYLSTAASVNEQDTLRSMLSSGARRWMSITASTASGGQFFRGYGFVDNWTMGGSQTSPVLHNFVIEGDGKITES